MQGVYFVGNITDNSIKIGYSSNIQKRIKQLSTGSSQRLTLLGYIESEKSLEKELHIKFSHHRIRSNGEWFSVNDNSDLIDYINKYSCIDLYIEYDNGLKVYKKIKL